MADDIMRIPSTENNWVEKPRRNLGGLFVVHKYEEISTEKQTSGKMWADPIQFCIIYCMQYVIVTTLTNAAWFKVNRYSFKKEWVDVWFQFI